MPAASRQLLKDSCKQYNRLAQHGSLQGVCCREMDAAQTRRAVSGRLQLPSVRVKDVVHEARPDLQCV